jgi:AraC-like DNA-binding protein
MHTYPLDEALHYLRMSGTFYCTVSWSAPWATLLPATGGEARFHVITHGHAYLKGPGIELRRLKKGDLVLLPQGAGHQLADSPATPPLPDGAVRSEFFSDGYAHFTHGNANDTQLICVKARFHDPTAQRLISLLPKIIHVPSEDSETLESIEATIRFIAQEAHAMRPGGETILTRLADVLLVQTIRWWIENEPDARIGWLGALRDRQIGRVIMLIHRRPAHAWTLDSLAAEVAMSRSLLAARFKELVGEPVMRYITRWRMQLAVTTLREEKIDIGQLAGRLGYQSESSFNRAFKRYVGMPPGAVRASRLMEG